jgi:hypothetical protein
VAVASFVAGPVNGPTSEHRKPMPVKFVGACLMRNHRNESRGLLGTVVKNASMQRCEKVNIVIVSNVEQHFMHNQTHRERVRNSVTIDAIAPTAIQAYTELVRFAAPSFVYLSHRRSELCVLLSVPSGVGTGQSRLSSPLMR